MVASDRLQAFVESKPDATVEARYAAATGWLLTIRWAAASDTPWLRKDVFGQGATLDAAIDAALAGS